MVLGPRWMFVVTLVWLAMVVCGSCQAAVDAEWGVSLRASSDPLAKAYCLGTALFGTSEAATDGPPADPVPTDSYYTQPFNDRVAEIDCIDLSTTKRWQVDRRAPITSGEKTWRFIVYAGDTFGGAAGADTIHLTVWNESGASDAAPDDGLRVALYSVQQFGGARTLVGELDLDQNGHFTPTAGMSGYYLQSTYAFVSGLCGDTEHPYRFELVASVAGVDSPAVTDDGAFSSGTDRLHASWAAPDASGVLEYQYAIGTSPQSLVVGWTSAGLSTQATRTGLSLQPDAVYYWYVRARYAAGWGGVGVSDGIRAARACSIGQARTGYVGKAVYLANAVVASLAADPAGLWLVSENRSSGVSIGDAWECDLGDRLDVAGVVNWADGVPVVSGGEIKGRRAGTPLRPIGFTGKWTANDYTESLDYCGLNTVGLPVVVYGQVTAREVDNCVLYVDDGSWLRDGMGPAGAQYIGLRVVCPRGVALPALNSWVRASGVRAVRKAILEHDGVVNGIPMRAGDTVYLPVLAARGSIEVIR